MNNYRLPIIVLLIVILSLPACRPKGILSSRQMRQVIIDLHKTEALLDETGISRYNSEARSLYYAQVLERHETTQAQFDSSLVWYTQHPQRFNKIYPRVLQRLEAEHALFVDESEQIKALLATRKQHFELFTFERVIGSLQHGYPLNDYSLPPVDTIQVTIPLRDESTD